MKALPIILSALLTLPATLGWAAPAGADGTEYRLGALGFRAPEQTLARWQATADYLTETIPDARFRVAPMNYPQLEAAIADGTVDFVLTNTGHYVRMEAEHGLTRLVTMIAEAEQQPVRVFGGVILTRADRHDIQTLSDLAGRHVYAVGEGSLGGWHVGREALLDVGVDPARDLARVTFTGMPHDQVVEAVLAGEGDAGMVRTGILESMAREGRLDLDAVRVLEPRRTAGFPLQHSTHLYPEWPFSRLPHTPDAIAQAVTIALLEMPSGHPAARDGGYVGWSAPLSYGGVHELFQRLGEPPYEHWGGLDLRVVWEQHPAIVLALMLIVTGGMAGAVIKYRRLNRSLAVEVDQRRMVERQLRQHQARLTHLANHDPLTDLPNRLLLTTRLEQAVARATGSGQRVAVLFLDLDRFKNINDSLGHAVGDDLLRILAERLRSQVEANTVARLGGDEFIVLLDGISDLELVDQQARELLELVAESFSVGGWRSLQVGGSIGISLFPDNAQDASELITQADAAMYLAKAEGRNTYRYYNQSLTAAASERLETETRLRRALELDHLEVFYQPQLDITTGALTGVEALVRWRDPEQGLIPPDRFIPVAEETGLIDRLGQQVLERACLQVAAWDRDGLPALDVAVNLSAHQIGDPRLCAKIRHALERSGLAPRRLVLEITESTLMTQAEGALGTLAGLKGLGVQVAIDDFGTGYSSLAYLKRFAIDWLKVDRCFVQDLPEDRNDAELTQTIVYMAHNLGLRVLAEGVETQAQLDFLTHLGCDGWQGFLCSPPLPPQELVARLESREGLRRRA
ncbi:EAL domain-containing protein [Alkalilimnicola ehrlichii MLHE-1]|uniref:cyclic-guanylate-specific phosphodiesterase n=1 Tax=Alkalilimnicola ehrlichii (strain ATCC BAA-1101 / DSM 17681 / MLHE-1) TaxID=187272 RepID=Q0A5U6_ALKEH|nr:EAL domain-containing protein [Alkalilimnicola ehrlichii]ABI57791.1 periplasmic sensor diguanylate cyclase/phosphodiesterase [Alkalilimnicola ehrlichii MLHE-1]